MTSIRLRLCFAGALLTFSSGAKAQDIATASGSAAPLTLGDAIRLALENNRNIKVEAYAPAIAQANVLAAIGQFDPALNFGRSHGTSYNYPTAPAPLASELIRTDGYNLALGGILPTGLNYSLGGYADNVRWSFNNFAGNYDTFAGLSLSQPLLRGFGFGANLANVRIARANRSISEWDYRQTLITTVANVVITYSSLVLAHDNLNIAQRSRELAATLLTESQLRLKAGSGAQSDVTTARAQVAQREEPILVAENAVRISENTLRELIGEKSFPTNRTLLVTEAPPPLDLLVKPLDDYRTALENRPDYQAAKLGITINRANHAAARNGLLPQVNLVWNYGYNGLANSLAASRHMLASQDFPSSSIGVSVSIPITNAQGRGRARAARLALEQSEADLERLEADIALEVANAAGQIETARQRVAADRAAYNVANQALKDEVKKLRDGKSTTLSVIQSQLFLIAVENSVASALSAERQAAANYAAQLGTILQGYNITLAAIRR